MDSQCKKGKQDTVKNEENTIKRWTEETRYEEGENVKDGNKMKNTRKENDLCLLLYSEKVQ
jgi:hypothetical protein